MADDDIVKAFGKMIAARRNILGITQEEFASRLGISTDAVSRMENGRMAPKMSRLGDIAEVLGCSVADLFRVADKNASDRANTIATLLHPLPDEAQEALVDIVFKTAWVVQRGYKAAK